MITDNQAKEAVKTIEKYCQEHFCQGCDDCYLKHVCLAARFHGKDPYRWSDYLPE